MSQFQIHSIATAPPASRPILAKAQEALGMIPNLAAGMAESPSLVKGFFALRAVQSEGTLSPLEVQVLSMTNAFENGCDYCMALHSTLAAAEGLSAASMAALRAGRSPVEPRLAALSDLSRALLRRRGCATETELEAFHAAGLSRAEALEVILGIAVSIGPNYAHHLIGPPLDAAFEGQRWSAPKS